MLIFDFDGVICDSFDSVLRAFEEITSNRLIIEQSLIHEKSELRKLEAIEVFRFFGIKKYEIPLAIIKLRKIMKSKIHSLKVVENMPSVLKLLKKTGLKMGIISTNSEENVDFFLKNNHMDYFDFISSAGLLNKANILKKIIKKEKLDFTKVFYIGDETRDIIASRKAGIQSIAVGWGYNDKELLLKYKPDYFIDAPEELISIINNKN